MHKRIEIVGAKPKKIEVVDRPKQRIEPDVLARALGAALTRRQVATNLDLNSLGELGTHLLQRLRSSGGRPALADATEICRVPLSAVDLKTLEAMVAQIGASRARNRPSASWSASLSTSIWRSRPHA